MESISVCNYSDYQNHSDKQATVKGESDLLINQYHRNCKESSMEIMNTNARMCRVNTSS